MLRALSLDFCRRTRGLSVWGAVLLLAGAVALGEVLMRERELAGQIAHAEAQRAELARQGQPRPAAPRPAALQEEIRNANAILDQLSLPWAGLFRALEPARPKEIALLAIEPDAQKRRVRIEGEAKHFKALLDYIAALEDTPALTTVQLASHELRKQEPEKPVRFVLTAQWSL